MLSKNAGFRTRVADLKAKSGKTAMVGIHICLS
jgi:hypothetical protein